MQFEDGKYIMDSKVIVERLEKDHPSPALHLDSPLISKIEKLLPKVLFPLIGIWLPLVSQNLLNPRSKEYYDRTNEAKIRKPLSELARSTDGEVAWEKATPGLKELGEVVKANGGPFVMGTTGTLVFEVVNLC